MPPRTGARSRRTARAVVRRGLSLYVHLPFCNTICYYCACNKVITQGSRARREVRPLCRARARARGRAPRRRRARRAAPLGRGHPDLPRARRAAHADGNDPQPLSAGRRRRVFDRSGSARAPARRRSALLASLGFNRLSRRRAGLRRGRAAGGQPPCRASRRPRPSIDGGARARLQVGEPRPDLRPAAPGPDTHCERTLAKVLHLAPDRIALYNYAHLPGTFKPQRRIAETELPSAAARIDPGDAGDANPHRGGLPCTSAWITSPCRTTSSPRRSGWATSIAISRAIRRAPSATSSASASLRSARSGPRTARTCKTLDEYYDRLDRRELPVMRGIELSADDLVRRAVIQALMCHFELVDRVDRDRLSDRFRALLRRRARRPARARGARAGRHRRRMDHRHAAWPAGRARHRHGVRPLPAPRRNACPLLEASLRCPRSRLPRSSSACSAVSTAPRCAAASSRR